MSGVTKNSPRLIYKGLAVDRAHHKPNGIDSEHTSHVTARRLVPSEVLSARYNHGNFSVKMNLIGLYELGKYNTVL